MSKAAVTAVAVALCVASAVVRTASFHWYPTTTVHVINGMKAGSPVVSLHCESLDDDLGFHQLWSPGQEYKFSFSRNLWGTTLFHCTLWWNSKKIEKNVYDAWFDEEIRPNLYFKASEQGLAFSYNSPNEALYWIQWTRNA